VNVANLLLARGAGRSRELALLAAVGASSSQITRRFFVEGVLFTLVSVGLGIALAAGGVRTLSGLAPPSLLLLGEPSVNAPVLGFTLVISIAICLGFGFLPTIQARRIDLQTHLKEGRTADRAPTALRLRRLLVGGQLALAVVLLLGASLLITTVQNLQAVDPGFRAENSVRVDFALPASYAESMQTYPDWPRVHQLVADMESGVEAIPGVRSASVILNHSLDPGFTNSFRIEGQSYDPSHGEMTTRLVSPSYFETAGLTLASGRLLDDGDRADAPFAILLNETAANRYFPDGDALGQRIAFWGPLFREVVGIVKDERVHGLTAEVPPAMYVSLLQAPPRPGRVTLLARTEVSPLSIVEGIRTVVRGIDPSIPVFNVATMEETLDQAMARERFASTVLTILAAVALFLALLGVHGVLAYLVAQRGHEVGVRMALGATRRDVVGMVLRQGASMTSIGIVGGVAAALAASSLIQGLLHGVSATSPSTYVGVVAAMILVSLAATALPARRAASVDPATSLRGE
jgi:predicted permease